LVKHIASVIVGSFRVRRFARDLSVLLEFRLLTYANEVTLNTINGFAGEFATQKDLDRICIALIDRENRHRVTANTSQRDAS
jgi:hypothetical protein